MTHREAPGWINVTPPAAMMVSFFITGLKAVLAHSWLPAAACIIGIFTAAATWALIIRLREQITVLKGQAVRDAYEISSLQTALRREQSWRN